MSNVLVTWPSPVVVICPAGTPVHGPSADGAVSQVAVAPTPAGPSATAVIVSVAVAARFTSTGPLVSTGAGSTVRATALLCTVVAGEPSSGVRVTTTRNRWPSSSAAVAGRL